MTEDDAYAIIQVLHVVFGALAFYFALLAGWYCAKVTIDIEKARSLKKWWKIIRGHTDKHN